MKSSAAPLHPDRFVVSENLKLAVYHWPARRSAGAKPATILLVHGYPDSAQVWQTVAESLAAHFEVFAYDVRGAGQSDAPRKVSGYALPHLMQDLAAVLDAISPRGPVHLVAHDWGSIASWEAVSAPAFAGRFASYTSISGPGLDLVGAWARQRLRGSTPGGRRAVAAQLLHSWYIVLFQLPGLSPFVWKAGLGRLWPRLLQRLERLDAVHRNPTQTRDGVNGIGLYRANVIPRLWRPAPRVTTLPVRLLVPRHDPFVSLALLADLPRYAPNLTRREIDGSHWLPLSQPARLAAEIEQFIRSIKAAAPRRTRIKAPPVPAVAEAPRPRRARRPAR